MGPPNFLPAAFRSSSRRTPEGARCSSRNLGFVFDRDEDVMGSADHDVALVSEAVTVTFGGELIEVRLDDDGSDSVSISLHSGGLTGTYLDGDLSETGTYLRRDGGTDSSECS